MGYTQALSKFVAEISCRDLPAEVVKKTKDTIMDTLGCGIAGCVLAAEEMKPLLEIVRESNGRPESTVFGSGFKTSCLNAVLANGTMVHTVDFDDTHLPSIAHFGACVVPVALAVGEKIGASGADIIAAVVAGYEAGGRIGRSVMPAHYNHWHSTATNGTMAAAATAGRLLGLNPEEMEMALGMAADQAAGGRYCLDHGDFTKSLHPGMAAWKGTLAALLVKKGAAGPKGILEYPTGYCNVYSSEPNLGKITENLGAPYEIMVNDFKAFPSILCSHTPIQAVLEIVRRHDLDPDDVERVTVRRVALPAGQGSNYNPETPLAARLSTQYCLALAIIEKQVTLRQFDWSRIHNPQIRGLMKKVVITDDPGLNEHFLELPAYVDIVTRDGKTYHAFSKNPKGSTRNPMTSEELLEKFFSLASFSLEKARAEEVAKVIAHLEEAASIDQLTALLK